MNISEIKSDILAKSQDQPGCHFERSEKSGKFPDVMSIKDFSLRSKWHLLEISYDIRNYNTYSLTRNTMNILFISHRIPYPPNKGDRIRSYNILKYLAKRHTVYLAFLIDNNENINNIEPLNNMVEELYYEEISPFTKKVLSCLHLLGREPLSVPYFYSKKLQHKIQYRLRTTHRAFRPKSFCDRP